MIKYYETFQITLDTADYVPQSFNKRILRYIFKNMKKQFRLIDKEDREYQRKLLKNPPVADEGQQSESSNVVNVQRNEPGLENPGKKESVELGIIDK